MLLMIILLVFSISIDSFFAGLAYGGKGVQIPFLSKMIICSLSVIYTFGAMYAGKFISGFMPDYVARLSGCILLFALGVFSILSSAIKAKTDVNSIDMVNEKNRNSVDDDNNLSAKNQAETSSEKELFRYILKKPGITIKVIKNPDSGDIDSSGKISGVEAFLLGLALSVDSISTGIVSGVAGITSPLIPLGTGTFQYFLLYCGEKSGRMLHTTIKKRRHIFAFFPGVTLIILSILRWI